MSDRRMSLRAAAVLARHRAPAGRRQRNLPAAHRRSVGRSRASKVTLRTARYPGSPRREVVDGVQISRAGGRYSVYIWAGLAMVVGPARARPAAAGAARRGDRHPERPAVHGPVGVRPTGSGAGAPLPPRAVAGGGSGAGQNRLVRRVEAVAAGAPPQPVRHGVAAVGAGPDGARCRLRIGSPSCATGSTRRRRTTLTAPRSATPRVAVLSRLVPHKQIEDALDAIAELRARIPDVHLDVLGGGWWDQHLVDHAAAARHLRCGHLPRSRRRRHQTRGAATVLGACAAVAQRGLGVGGDGGRAAWGAHRRLPVLGWTDGFDRRRRHRHVGRRLRRTGRRPRAAAVGSGAARTARRQGCRFAVASSPGGRAPMRCARCWSRCTRAGISAASSSRP